MERMHGRTVAGMGRRSFVDFQPAADVQYEDGRFSVEVDLPGIDPRHDVKVECAGPWLTVRGRRPARPSRADYWERSVGSFSRRFQLPAGARADDCRFSYRRGVLRIVVPLDGAGSHGGMSGPIQQAGQRPSTRRTRSAAAA